MKIKELTVQGFGSFKEKTSFIFNPKTVYLITGENGSGKSTLFCESFSILLYGRPYKEGMKVADIVNDFSDKYLLQIKLEDGAMIKSGLPVPEEIPDRFLFFNSVVFGQGFGGFVYFRDSEKKDFITKLSLGYIDNYLDKMKEIKKNYYTEGESYISTNSGLREELSDVKEQKEKLRKLYRTHKLESRSLKNVQLKEISKLKKNLEQMNKDILVNQKFIKKDEKECSRIQDSIKDKSNLISISEHEERNFEIEEQRLLVQLGEHSTKLDKLKKVSTCPFCDKKILSKEKTGMILKLKKESKIIMNAIKSYSYEKKKFHEEIEKLNVKIKKLHDEQNKYIESAKKMIENNSVLTSDKNHCATLIAEKEKTIEEKTINPYKLLYEDIDTKEIFLKEKLSIAKKSHEIAMYWIKAADRWLFELSDFKSKMFTKILSQLEPLANTYLNFISEGKFFMKITSQMKATKKGLLERFKVGIFHKSKEVNFGRLSGGEKRLVTLAVNIALIQLLHLHFASEFNFLVLDEIFENLDSQRKEKVIELIDNLRVKTGKAIVIITHDDFVVRDREGFEHWEVYSKGNSSHIRRVG